MTTASILVQKACRGDLEAFEQLVLLYQDRVYSHCVNLTGNYDDGQDLAQEVFVRAFRGISSFRGQADFGTWLHRIAINCWINWINMKKNKNWNTLSIDETLTFENSELKREIAATEESPLESVERQEFQAAVRQAVDHLAPEFSSVLILREMEGYSYQEIADIMECSLGTVKSRISRARRDLKQEIEKRLGSEAHGLPKI